MDSQSLQQFVINSPWSKKANRQRSVEVVVSDGAAAARSSGCCPYCGSKFKAVSSTPDNIVILAAPPDRKTDCPKTSSPVNSRPSPVMVSCWVMASRDITIQVIQSGRVLRFTLRLLRLYRTRQLTWHQGTTVNLSRSGVLARGQQPMKPNTPTEISFVLSSDLPEAASAKIVYSDRIVRTGQPSGGVSPPAPSCPVL